MSKQKDITSRYGPWAVITGASSGIGAEFTDQLAAAGLNVFLVARREERLAALAARLEKEYGIEAAYSSIDLTDPGAADRVASATEGLDVGMVVNNAGGAFPGKFASKSIDEQLNVIDLNYRSPVAVTHTLVDRLRGRSRSGIIFVSSSIGYGPAPYLGTYGASKMALRQFAFALNRELRGDGVDVQVLSPGPTRTELASELMGEKVSMAMEPEEVVKTSLRGLGRKTEIIPGLFNKTMVKWTSRVLPTSAAAAMNAKFTETLLPVLADESAVRSAA